MGRLRNLKVGNVAGDRCIAEVEFLREMGCVGRGASQGRRSTASLLEMGVDTDVIKDR